MDSKLLRSQAELTNRCARSIFHFRWAQARRRGERMRKRTLLLPITVACVAAAAALGWVTIRRGFSARDNPSAIETLIATPARQLAVPSQYRQLRNPLSSSSDLHAGIEHFADHCASCHANDGSGDTLFGKGLYSKPPDTRQEETQNKSDGELYYTIENGIRLSGMPAFGEGHAKTGDMETWNLAFYPPSAKPDGGGTRADGTTESQD